MRDVWYPQNKRKHILLASKNSKRTAAERHWLVDEIKTAFGCIDCGYNHSAVALDFDHLREKSFDISQGIGRGLKLDTILDEIEKCEVRCANCHRIKTHMR